MSSDPPEVLDCPVCGARQSLSPLCRRCQCDLSLLVAAIERGRFLRAETMRSLREGRGDEAAAFAEQRLQIDPDEDAARLLAICYLMQGRLRAAFDVFERFHASP